MMIIEFREAAYEKAFDLLDETKEHLKAGKMTLCALEDALYDCYETSGGEEIEDFEDPMGDYSVRGEFDLHNYRRNRRSHLRNMRDNDDMEYMMNRRNMRMRRRSRRY